MQSLSYLVVYIIEGKELSLFKNQVILFLILFIAGRHVVLGIEALQELWSISIINLSTPSN